LRPVQAAAIAHRAHPRTANIPFTTDFLQAQQRIGNIRNALYPATPLVEDEYIALAPGPVSQPPAYSTSSKPAQTHQYNTRLQNRIPEARDPQSVLPPVPNQNFEMH
jgi:hypothetical protein